MNTGVADTSHFGKEALVTEGNNTISIEKNEKQK